MKYIPEKVVVWVVAVAIFKDVVGPFSLFLIFTPTAPLSPPPTLSIHNSRHFPTEKNVICSPPLTIIPSSGHPFGVPSEERYIKSATGGYIPGKIISASEIFLSDKNILRTSDIEARFLPQ